MIATHRVVPAESFLDEDTGGEEETTTAAHLPPTNDFLTRRSSVIVHKILVHLILVLVIYFFTVNYICAAQYFWREDGSWVIVLCRSNSDNGWTWGIEKNHPGFAMWPHAILLALLLCMIPTILLIFPVKTHYLMRRGDPSIRFWSILLLVLSTAVIFLLFLGRPLPDNRKGFLEHSRYADLPGFPFLILLTAKWANVTGYCAVVTLSLFMVPVSRQSPLMEALGMSPAWPVGFHIWAGRLSLILVLLRGSLYCIEQSLLSHSAKSTFWGKLSYEMFPTHAERWKWESPWYFLAHQGKDGHCTNGEISQALLAAWRFLQSS